MRNHESRRQFIKKAGVLASGVGLTSLASKLYARDISEALSAFSKHSPKALQSEEDFWSRIRLAYGVSPTMVNLNNGGVSPQATIVSDALKRYTDFSNQAPSFYMWRRLDADRSELKARLAEVAGTSAGNIAINRNTTEALDTAIFGMNLKADDEVILSPYDYPNMKNAWEQRRMRDGIVLRYADVHLPVEDDDELISKYKAQLTGNTKVIHLTRMINWTGRILPLNRLMDWAKSENLITVVDEAHSFMHIPGNIDELDCDYWGTSLHKWTGAPFGTGLLYVNPKRIAETWPMFPGEDPQGNDIMKFENLGTRSFPAEFAIGQALDFQEAIGLDRKTARLKYLSDYWVNQVMEHPKIKLYTSIEPGKSCAIVVVGIDGMKGIDIDRALLKEHRIHTVAIEYRDINGVRVTPNVYTTPKELNRLASALLSLADSV